MNNFTWIDRIISFLTYYTFGGVGVFWMIICAVAKKHTPKLTKTINLNLTI